MSVVSSILSTRSPGWKINVRLVSLMDSIFAIGFGLGLRFVVDTVSHHDFKLTGTLVGLWEGVILLHFLKKMPKSSDPFIAYAVRLFIDFLFTESVARMVLVLIWTALGMVLADITPAIWDDVGLKRIWKRFRRDIYTMTQMIPIVAFFPPARTVRFSPSRAPSVISEAPTGITPSVAPTGQTPTTTEREPVQRRHVVARRRLPGYFSMDTTDTETDAGSVISVGTFGGITGRTARRLSVYPGRMDLDSQSERSTPSQNDLDEGNLSDTSSNVTERGPYSALPDPESIPDMEVEEPLHIDVTAAPVKLEDGEVTPTNKQPYYMPPTPSDSAIRWPRENDEPRPVLPTSASVPEIPDFLEEANTEDWEKIQRADYTDEQEKPPTPPAKDDLPAAYREQAQVQPQTETPPEDLQNWETLASQIIFPTNNESSNDNNNDTNETKEKVDKNPQPSTSAAANRQSQPPPYDYPDDFDDMYASDPPMRMQEKGGDDVDLLGGDSGVPPETIQPQFIDDVFGESTRPLSDLNFGQGNPWSKGFASQALEVEAARQRDLEAEAERARQQEEEIERLRQEEIRQEEERHAEEVKRLQEEKEEKKRQRQEKKRLEQEEAQRQKEEEEKRAEEEKAEKERVKEEKKKKRAEEKAERLRKELEDEAARQKKREEEAEAARLQEEEEKMRRDEAEAARLKEEEEKKKREEEAKRIEEEAEANRQKEAAEALAKEEAEKQRLEAERKAEEDRLERERVKQEEEEKRKQQLADEEAQRAEEAKTRKEEDLRKLQEEVAQEQADADAAETGRRTPTLEDPQIELGPTTDVPEEVPTPEQDPHPAEERDPFPDSETVVTDASEVPSKVRERLHRLLLTKAQIFELETLLRDLQSQIESQEGEAKVATEESIKATEKALRKHRRKEDRRATEVPAPLYIGEKYKGDSDDTIMCDSSIGLGSVETKIEEKLESMLLPEVRSLRLMVKAPTGKGLPQRIMQNVTKALTRYELLPYSIPDKNNARISQIDISEDKFGEWLASYRHAATKAEEDEGGIWR